MLYGFLFLLFACSVYCRCVVAKCPEFDPADACSCRILTSRSGDESITISCRSLVSEEALQRVLRATRGHDVFELELVDCLFRYLPHDAFVGTMMQVLSIHNSSIHSLSDSSVAFEGLDNRLHLLEVINCSYASEWDWTQLSNLRHLQEVHISKCADLTGLTSGLGIGLAHVGIEGFTFHSNAIAGLEEDAFAVFHNLQYLYLGNNEIGEVRRSMLPNPAPKLRILGLSYNKLTDLPEDIFSNMPRLRTIYLHGNPLQTIQEATFKPIWSHVGLLLFYETRLMCDCELTWLTREDNSKKFMHAECEGPLGFKGRLLSDLKEEELLC